MDAVAYDGITFSISTHWHIQSSTSRTFIEAFYKGRTSKGRPRMQWLRATPHGFNKGLCFPHILS